VTEATSRETQEGDRPIRIIKRFERIVVFVLLFLLMIVVTLVTVELAWLLVRDLSLVRERLFDVEDMFELFGSFLMVLIGMELITTLKGYVAAGVFHVEVVLEVALVALAQKVIILDLTRASGFSVLGLAGLILAVAGAFWWVHAARGKRSV
jgi:uncharacterized membrane protein (DUF373 family)